VDASPLPVEIDGQQVQRYAQAVEVLSGSARLGPGPVTLSPSELTTEILSTAGEASQVQPGLINIANGEVTFRLGLPLEAAAALQPSKVTIILAGDASTIFYDQENVGAFLPSGYRVAVYDVVAADWVDLGDLSERSRFDVADASRVLDPAGRILVKVTGSGIPAALGQVPVFAGARVAGVMP
jgi:hypothetical protein